ERHLIGQACEGPLLHPLELLEDRVVHVLAERLVAPVGARDADDRNVQVAPPRHAIEGRKQLLARQIPGGPKNTHGSRTRCWLGHEAPSSGTTAWPPNWLRIIASILSAKVSSSRLLKRAKSDIAMMGAGTSSSMAASTVQRPSPVSST